MAKVKGRMTWFRRALTFALLILASLLSLSFVVQIPIVQTFGINHMADFLSKSLDTDVAIGEFRANIFRHLTLKDVFIGDPYSETDTLLHARELSVNFGNPLSLLSRKLRINAINFNGVYVRVSRPDGKVINSIDLLVDRLQLQRSERTRNPIRLEMDRINARDASYTFDDGNMNRYSTYRIQRAEFVFDSLNLAERTISLSNISVDRPSVLIDQLSEPDTIVKKAVVTSRDTLGWTVAITEFSVQSGGFRKVRFGHEDFPHSNAINYGNLNLSNINFRICDFWLKDGELFAQIEGIRLQEQSGLEITRASIGSIHVGRNDISLTDFQLNTAASYIGDTIRLNFDSFDDFGDFANKVSIDAWFNDTRIAINDLLRTIPGLNNSEFFRQNAGLTMVLSGHLSGRINRLIGEDIFGELGRLTFRGDFRSRNLAVKDEQMVNLRIQRADLDPTGIRQILPGVKLPGQFNKLGKMRFSGNFDGFFYDFVAFGELRTALGTARTDMRLDVLGGADLAEYSGNVELVDFDVGKWADDPNLGKLSFRAQVYNGVGLTAETANARLAGTVFSMTFKDYLYQDVVIDGQLNQRFFDGSLTIDDPNLDLVFNGSIDMKGDNPVFDFAAQVDTINLTALNLSKDTLGLSGNIRVSGLLTDQYLIDGFAQASGLVISRGINETYTIDSFRVRSLPRGDSLISYVINSDYISGSIDGKFTIRNGVAAIRNFLADNYGILFPKIKKAPVPDDEVDMYVNVELKESEKWLGALGAKGIEFTRVNVTGEINLDDNIVDLGVASPDLSAGPARFTELLVKIKLDGGNVYSTALADSMYLNNNGFRNLEVLLDGDQYELDWHLGLSNIMDTLYIDWAGILTNDSTGLHSLSFDPANSDFFDGQWKIRNGNLFEYKKNYLNIENFVLRKGANSISIDDIENRGLKVRVDSFDLSFINVIWDYEKLNFAGAYTLSAQVDDIFDPNRILAQMSVDDLVINGDSYGVFKMNTSVPEFGEPLIAQMNLDRPGSHLDVSARYYLPLGKTDPALQNSFTGEIKLDTFPLAFLEYWLGDAVEDTRGYGIGKVTIKGDTSNTDMSGSVRVYDASTSVIVLGTRYYINNQRVFLTRDFIDLSGVVLTDEKGNRAYVDGGLTHTLMARMGLDLRIESPNVIGLNLRKGDNDAFYGYAEGEIEAIFEGPVIKPSLVVNAITRAGTHIYIPVGGSSVDLDSRFIRFVSQDSVEVISTESNADPTGLNLLVNLTITPDAEVDIIFDERTRDIISGIGSGNIQMELLRSGDFNIYGSDEIESGDYLFTNVVVNKPFVLRPGGTVRWSGDPYDATINIVADYTGIRTSLNTFLEEYLVTASTATQEQARQKTDVRLELILTGSLLTPNINFQISFPEVTGELRGYVDSKMSTLRADQNALNEQVFGLLTLGTFLPSNFSGVGAGNSLLAGSVNTLSEFISSQLSYYISDIIASAIEDVGFISSIDVSVGYNESYDYSNQSASYTEWETSIRSQLFNDRFIVDVGGNYVTDNPAVAGAYFAGDYALEYVLTEDRRLKVRFYYKTDETIEGKKNKTGIGLSYRREFDNFGDWIRGLEKDTRKAAQDVRGDAEREGEQGEIQ